MSLFSDHDEDRRTALLAKRAALTDAECARLKRELDITQYFNLAAKVAFKYFRGHFDLLGGMNDTIQLAHIALLKVRDKWDPRRGAFATTAALWVRAELGEEVEKAMKRDGVARQDRPSGRYLARKGRAPKSHLQSFSYRMVSADAPIGRGADGAEGGSVLDDLAADGLTPEQDLIAKQDRESVFAAGGQVHEALAKLSPREQRIIEARYLADPVITLDDLSQELALSRERVRQIEKKALARIKAALEGAPAKPPRMPKGAAAIEGRALVASLPAERLRAVMAQLSPRDRRIIEARWLADEPIPAVKLGREIGGSVASLEVYTLGRVRKLLATEASATAPKPKPGTKAPKPPRAPRPPKEKKRRTVRRRVVGWERDPVTRKNVPVRWEIY